MIQKKNGGFCFMRKSDLKTIKEVNAYIRSLEKLARAFYEVGDNFPLGDIDVSHRPYTRVHDILKFDPADNSIVADMLNPERGSFYSISYDIEEYIDAVKQDLDYFESQVYDMEEGM